MHQQKDIDWLADENMCMYALPLTTSVYLTPKPYEIILYCSANHVFLHPASLCRLVGTFNPFTFKVIIDMYDPITISLIVLGLFSVSLFLLLFPA